MTIPDRSAAPEGVDADSLPFWQSWADGRLMLPWCSACGTPFFPPLPRCPFCRSAEVTSRESAGHGQVYSWVTVHAAGDAQLSDRVPYSVVAVELDEGPRVFGRWLEAGPPTASEHVTLCRGGPESLIGVVRNVLSEERCDDQS